LVALLQAKNSTKGHPSGYSLYKVFKSCRGQLYFYSSASDASGANERIISTSS